MFTGFVPESDLVAFYRQFCRREPAAGPVLELGCGNGRILLPLLAEGIDVVGVDASMGMLAALSRKAQMQGLPARVARMDIRALGLRPGFGVILCPYSLITYLQTDDEVDALLKAMRTLLRPGGQCVVDAFIPRPRATATGFTLDYRRSFGSDILARWKRITAISATVNRIERRYVVEDALGDARDVVEVVEDIRPRTDADLAARLINAGFAAPATSWDYGAAVDAGTAQFATLVARCPPD